jgi:hypothetical protein
VLYTLIKELHETMTPKQWKKFKRDVRAAEAVQRAEDQRARERARDN